MRRPVQYIADRYQARKVEVARIGLNTDPSPFVFEIWEHGFAVAGFNDAYAAWNYANWSWSHSSNLRMLRVRGITIAEFGELLGTFHTPGAFAEFVAPIEEEKE